MNGNGIYLDAGAMGLIVGVVQVVKAMIPDTWKKFLPLFAIVFGVVYTTLLRPEALELGQQILLGLTLGLGAVGMQDSSKTTAKGLGFLKEDDKKKK